MTTTLDEIATHRSNLRQEIMERECLRAAFDVVEKYATNGHAPRLTPRRQAPGLTPKSRLILS